MQTNRRTFLRWLGVGTTAAASAPLALVPSNAYGASLPAASDEWDVSWTRRIAGKCRAVFDIPEIGGELGFNRATLWRQHAMHVYGLSAADTTLVTVFRRNAIHLIMNDAYWQRFEMGTALKLDAGAKGAPHQFDAFVASGGIVLACNLAFGQVVNRYRAADNLSRDDAMQVARANIAPGVILQPSGLFALVSAQQAGCALVPTT